MEAIAKSFIIKISTITTSLTYSYFISSKLPKGIYRFISLIPIIFIFTILPLYCSSVFTTAIMFSFITWLANFKLIRFAFDLDHSPYHSSYSLLRFITISCLPIKVNSNLVTVNPAKPPKPANFKYFKLGFQMVVFVVLVQILLNLNKTNQFHEIFVLAIYCGLLVLIIDIVNATINAILLITLTGLELEKSSNQPYFSTSLQTFWTRWNLMVKTSLRHTVYKPILSTLSNYKWAPLAAILGSFIVSGLMHELFVYHLSREKPTWEMTLFFVMHGVCVAVEMIVKRAVGGFRWRLPEFLAKVLTVGFVVVTGFWLFFPPLIRRGLDVQIFQEYMSFVEFIKQFFRKSIILFNSMYK